jgi:hypothetical protein
MNLIHGKTDVVAGDTTAENGQGMLVGAQMRGDAEVRFSKVGSGGWQAVSPLFMERKA